VKVIAAALLPQPMGLPGQTGGIETTTYIHTDALRSPVAETDANGNVIADSRNRYEPYGKALMPAAQGPGYTGHVTDVATGLSYMLARYYDPVAGRFLSTDPMAASATSFTHKSVN
jgi:RHS repeat-associated protein